MTDPLLMMVEEFLRDQCLPPSRFGAMVAGDPSLVLDMRNGRELRRSTRARLMEFMARWMVDRKFRREWLEWKREKVRA